MWDGGGCGAGVSIPRPKPRTKNSDFAYTCTRTQLDRFFPVKFGTVGSDRSGFCCHVFQILVGYFHIMNNGVFEFMAFT